MINERRTDELRVLRNLVIAGNLMEVAIRNPQHFSHEELAELANTWASALREVRASLISLLAETRSEA